MTTQKDNNSEQKFRVLYEISCAMRTTLDLQHILYIILTGVTSHSGLGYNRALLFLFNETKNRLECRMAIGPKSGEQANKIWQHITETNIHLYDLIDAKKLQETYTESALFHEFKDMTFPINTDDNILTQAFKGAMPWHIKEKEISQYTNDPLLKHLSSSSELLIIPLKAQDRVSGLIVADNVYTRKPITTHDIEFFTMLANQAGLAIENSRLYEIVVERSQTDALTGLWNHGFFQNRLTTEIENAKRLNQQLSLLFLDIDNFKQLNDTCGHQHGDTILKEIAVILKESARGQDCTCRYGGEEFAAILTDTNREQSYKVAERIRRHIEAHNFPSPSGVGHLNFTVSIGLASFPTQAKNKEQLIALADKAMYKAKKHGKNQTCLA